ncbi:MFS transporter [Geodermatophilus sp. DSM 45219]|uniref:MFS transporter n=1 Tax=Geodermatophilus sp. DSM 45219 TaxID=1881103 RepID=UPI001C409B14|nr:MFS transporter [Geodermatophilus sp. DSM 45219]
MLLVSMDMTVLHLAVPAITTALSPSGSQMLWIVDIYAFMVAGLLITMGAVGDRIGRRRLLLLGAAAFALASVVAAFATSPGMLIAARAALGVAGATLAPSTLALIRTMFTDPRQRSTATSVWVLAFLTGASIGPVVGGLLLQDLWWGSVFLLGVPVMAALLVAGPVLLPEYRAPSSAAVDLPSAALSLAAVLAAVYGLKEAAAGAGLLVPALAIGAGGLLAVAFARRQRRLPCPLLDLSLFRQRSFSVAIGVLTLGSVVLAGVGFLTAQHLQLVLGLSPLAAGLWTLPPLAAGIAAVVLVQTFGQRLTVAASTAAGLMVAAGGSAVLTQAPVNGVAVVATGLALLFAGLMPVLARGVDTVTASAPPDRAGAASALSETTQELGGALGIAALGSLTAAVYRTQISESLQGVPPPIADTARDTLAGALSVASDLPATVLSGAAIAFTDGLHTASAAGAVVLVVVAALAAVVLRPRPQPHTENSTREA